jgi:hypothetical protein
MSAEMGVDRARAQLDQMGYDTSQLSPDVLGEAQKAAAPPAISGLGSTGLVGLLGEGLVSSIGDFTGAYDYSSPIEQAQAAAMERANVHHPAAAERAQQAYADDQPGAIGPALGAVGSAIGDAAGAVGRAFGGYGSKEAAEEAGFTYNTGATGQISIDPPSMNIGGLDTKLGYSSKTQRQISQVEAKLGKLSPEETAIAAKYSKTKKAISKIQRARRDASRDGRSSGEGGGFGGGHGATGASGGSGGLGIH